MIKKILLCLFAFLFVLSAASASIAELTRLDEGTAGIRTVIYYVPATGNATEMTTAKCVARTIASRWGDRGEVLGGRYNSINNIPALKDEKTYKDVFARGTDTGEGQLNKKNRPSGYETTACDIWFIVPKEAEDKFINNEALMNNCRELLAEEHSLLHVVFIGNESQAVPAESAFGKLAAEGRTDWIFIDTDFQAAASSNKADDDLHTGNYFTAALYGRPADLPAVPLEDGNAWTFELPESASAFVLIDWNDRTGTADIKNAAGNPCPTTGTLSMAESKYAYKTGTMLAKMEAGSYSVAITSGSAAAIRVYWYPDLDGINPQIELQDTWNRGENEIILTTEKTVGTPENYSVQFVYQDNEDEASATTLFADSDGANRWVKKVSVGLNTEHVYITPSIKLSMADGNRIWEWKGDRLIRDVQSKGINVRSDAPTGTTIYTDKVTEAAGNAEYRWSDLFIFNNEDEPVFDIIPDETGEPSGLRCEKLEDGSGFRISAVAGDESASELTVTASGQVNEEKREHTMTFTRSDVSSLGEEIRISTAQQDNRKNVGETVTIIAKVPAETVAKWQQACSQIPAFPGIETLQLFCAPENEDYSEGVTLAGDPLTADISMTLPATMKTGTARFKAEIMTENRERSLVQETISTEVLNQIPETVQDITTNEKIRLTGFPWSYDRIDSLLKACFGTDTLFDLYVDHEDNLSGVRVTIENIQGLELPDYGDQNGNTWTFEVTNPGDAVEIAVTEPGEHIIRLSATDGVYESEVLETKVKVYSEVLMYASYAGLGLVALLLLLIIIRVIIQISKPSYNEIQLRCYASSDDDQERADEILSKTDPVAMKNFKKQGVSLSTLLILFRQPVLSKEYRAVADDITVFPSKSNGLKIVFGKEAMKTIGRHEKRENVAQGGFSRMRIGNVYIQIDNVQA